MEVFVSRAKYIAETILIPVDFSIILPDGVTLTGTPSVTITMDWGTDSNPSNILYGGTYITNSTIVNQNFKLGIPGNVYNIQYSATGTDNNVYEVLTRLAIFPNTGDAVPTWLPVIMTSYLYPYLYEESISSNSSIVSGHLLLNPNPIDGFTSNAILNSASIYGGQITYSGLAENFTSTPSFTSGSIYGGQISYAYEEGFKTSTAVISGSIYNSSISYGILPENFTSTPSLTSGSIF